MSDILEQLDDIPSPPPKPGTVCDDGCVCKTSALCVKAGRCERIVCWTCPYQDKCQNDPDLRTQDCYGDAYNCDVVPGVDCLAAK